ncbi:protein phosphatase CheZ [Massilia solisilvae]|uniref:Protein phosphatase CheZ n=1 Tax=Massilia solisilvae TaxID=1811225 RepID=A0ABT2BFA1_9BURK|nr:protein phosphatase CheZ [Massilia solisilvae]MCS0607172.1 protein phosphatase CheZ [Massilia solisilvae]
MTDAADDFDALFEEVAAQRANAQAAPAAAEAPASEPEAAPPAKAEPEDELEALFDQVSAERATEAPQAAQAEAGEEIQGDKAMFERLGSIVRLLHDSLRELGYDRALTEAATQINDAQDRLEYVATLTEQAANKVLNTLDEGMPAQDELSVKARDMQQRWDDLFAGKLSIDQFKALAGDSRQFAQLVADATDKEKARLLDIMMAQDFQDITGQLIKKVVNITKTVEQELAQLLRDNAPAEMREKLAQKEKAAPPPLMQGPSVPDVALDQDNVDDLLAELGF